jgi:DNA-binding response OmpR family regulator
VSKPDDRLGIPPPPGRAGGPAILVVDDAREYRRLFRHLFEDLHYRVLEAPDGVRALLLAQTERPVCLILDLVLPDMSGFDVLARLQLDFRTRDTPVIILTGTEYDVTNVERGLGGGAADYVMKPVNVDDLVARVRAAIQRRGP